MKEDASLCYFVLHCLNYFSSKENTKGIQFVISCVVSQQVTYILKK